MNEQNPYGQPPYGQPTGMPPQQAPHGSMEYPTPDKPFHKRWWFILSIVVVVIAVSCTVLTIGLSIVSHADGTASVSGSSVGFATNEQDGLPDPPVAEDLNVDLDGSEFDYQMFILDKSENIVDVYLFEIGTQYADVHNNPLLLLDEGWKQNFSENLRRLRTECREVIDYNIEDVPPSCRTGHAEFVLGVKDFDAMATKLDSGVDKVSGTEISASMDLMLSGAEHIDKANELFPF